MADGVATVADRTEACAWTSGSLPKGWAFVSIGEVAQLRSEKAYPKVDPELRFVGMDDIETDGLTVIKTRPFSEMKSAGNRYYAGDLLYGRLRPYLNKTAVMDAKGACSGELLVIAAVPAIDVRYLQFFMHSRRFVDWVSTVSSGDRPRISFDTAANFTIPLAPLAEQRRIVARVNELFAEIAEGEAALAAARKDLDTFRRALLKAAVTGELTKDWRVTNPVSETSQDLLTHVKRERVAKEVAKGRSRRTTDPRLVNPFSLAALPKNWAWTTLGSLTWTSSYGTSAKCSSDANGVAVLRIPNIREGAVVNRDLKYATVDLQLEADDFVAPGDLLVIRTNGSETLIGRGGVVFLETEQPAYFASYLIRFRLLGGELMWHWISQYFESPMVRQWMMGQIASSAGQYNVSQSNLASLPIPIPPLAEITEISRRLSGSLAAYADTLAMLNAEAADAARLKQSILKAAFEGRLVPQYAADEPASALLARVGATKLNVTRIKRGRARMSAS